MLTVPELSRGAVHVWLGRRPILGPGQIDPLLGGLSGDERRRAGALVQANDAEAFVLSRLLLRTLLAAYLGGLPGEVRFRYGPNGRPSLDPPGTLDFNLSHSGECVAVALGDGGPVGIDIEHLRPLGRLESLAADILAPGELAVWAKTSAEARLGLFFAVWTAKEAYLKATGVGVTDDLGKLTVLDATGIVSSLSGPGRSGDMSLQALRVSRGYAATLAAPVGAELDGPFGLLRAWSQVMVGAGPDCGVSMRDLGQRRVD